jgi:hypothetical protein
MALTKQVLPISLFQGVDTKTDDKVRVQGKMIKMQNAVYDKTLKLKKRNGYDEIDLDTTSDIINNATRLAKYKEELLILDDSKLYSRSESINKFIEKGSIYNIVPEISPVVRNPYEQSSLDSIVVNGIQVFVWNDSSGGCRYSVLDGENGNFLVSDSLVSSTGTNPRLGVILNNVYIFFAESSNLRYKKLNILEPSTLSSATTAFSNVETSFPNIATASSMERVYVTYNATSPNQVTSFYIDQNDNISTALILAGSNANLGLDIIVDEQGRIVLAFCGANVRYAVANANLTSFILTGTTLAIGDYRGITTSQVSDGIYRFYYQKYNANPSNFFIEVREGSTTGVGAASQIFARSLGIASQVIKYNNVNYLLTIHESSLQSTYFLLDENSNIVSKFSQGNGGRIPVGISFTKANVIDENTFLVSAQVKTKTLSDNGTFFSLLGANAITLDFLGSDTQDSAFLANNLHLSGGIIRSYDGSVINEHGFLLFPEGLTAGTTGTTTGFMSNGTYQYVAVYSWTDNSGQIHRSAPSPALTVTLSGGGSAQFQDVIIPTLRLTEKNNVVIELYRTENNGTIFYKVGPSNPTVQINDKTVDAVTIRDQGSDAQLIDNEILYTTGGVLENIAPPSAKVVAEFKNRIFLAGLEDKNQIQYSKERFEGAPVEFNDILVKQIKNAGGDITALEEMNEKLIIFKTDAIFFMSGDGPNNLGQQDSFTEPEQVTIDVGCTEPDSIVQTPQGIFFKSRKGIYLLDSGLGVQYIGADVEEFNDLYITSAKILPKFNQIRFLTETGECLVYNYFVNLWSTFTNHSGKSSETIGNDYYYIRSDGKLWKFNENSFSDAGSTIKMKMETSWLSFNQVQGFQRVYKALFLGEYKSAHSIVIKTLYNFNESLINEKIINSADFIDGSTYGEDSPYGSGSPYGTDGNVYQFRLNFKKQKCQSIKFVIEDSLPSVGEGLTLSAITLETGGKYGAFKVNQSKTFGDSQSTG